MIYFLFVLGFFVLIKGADLLVNGASSIAKKFKINDLVIGLTIVAFGTSAPELFVNISASLSGSSEIAVGNILGSNIANILLILGVSASIKTLQVSSSTVWKEIPFSLLAVIALGFLANDRLIDGAPLSQLSRIDGLIFICFFGIFIYYIIEISKKSKNNAISEDVSSIKPLPVYKSILFIILGLLGLVFGGDWIVNGAVKIAENAGVSKSLIGLTIVAVGTSLPEMATSVVAVYRGKNDIAIGNVVGSNIFNVFWILGISSIIKPLPFQPSCNVDIMVAILSSFLLFIFLFIGQRHNIQRWQGVMFLLIYVLYVVYLVLTDGNKVV
jgi:cation:H+ antiporter